MEPDDNFTDPTYYPKEILKKMVSNGVDIAGMDAITGTVGGSGRGTIEHFKVNAKVLSL